MKPRIKRLSAAPCCDCCGRPLRRIAAIGLVVLGRARGLYAICARCLFEIDAATAERREELFVRIECAVLPMGGTA